MTNDFLSGIWPEWQIVRQIGRGPFGVVYEAVRRDRQLESRAAIKVISIPSDPSQVVSLRSKGLDINATKTYLQGIVNDLVSEIRLMESFKGVKNIVSVEDHRVVEKTNEIGWNIYIRMELLTPLNRYIGDRTLTEREIIKLGCDICTALELCAKRNVIHRDIKPENIFINQFGDFKLGDFGIARKLENLTGGVSQRGTYNYMAPEIVKGSQYDATTDLYSLGMILYQFMNKNRLPFLDTDRQLLDPNERVTAIRRRLDGNPLPPPCDASPNMAAAIICACSPDPTERFASATAMKNVLMSVRANREMSGDLNKTVSVRRAPNVNNQSGGQTINTFDNTPAKKSNRSKIVAAILIGVILIAAVVAGIFVVPKLMDKNNESVDEYTDALDQQTDGDTQMYGETVSVERLKDNSGNVKVVFTGISSQGETVWTYETGTYSSAAQLEAVNDIGAYNGNYYLVENGSIYVLSIADGSILWVNSDFGGNASCSVFDNNSTLYLCGYYGPDLFIVDADGNTIKNIDSFDSEYYWPHKISYQGSQVAITFEGTPSGTEEEVYVNLSDYSTSIVKGSTVPQESNTAEAEPETPKISIDAVSNVTATSYLKEPEYGFVHSPSNVIDGSLSDAWVEGASGQGEGESITLNLDGIYKMSGFTINAGYQKSSSTFENNSRPARLLVTFSDGSSVDVYLDDVIDQQKITFVSPVETSSVTFKIVSVYPGSKYQDTAISEISLF